MQNVMKNKFTKQKELFLHKKKKKKNQKDKTACFNER